MFTKLLTAHDYVHKSTSLLAALQSTETRLQNSKPKLIQIERMIQSSARNSILRIYGWIQLSANCH